jgi:hypothetical protein
METVSEFTVEWYGPDKLYCLVTHKETGIQVRGTHSTNRELNKMAAVDMCASLLQEHQTKK